MNAKKSVMLKWYLASLCLAAAVQAGGAEWVVFDADGMAQDSSVRRGQVVEQTLDGRPGFVLKRMHAPGSGSWDNLQIQNEQPGPLRDRLSLHLSVNAQIQTPSVQARIRRIDLSVKGHNKAIIFEANNASYQIDGKDVPRKLWIDLDRDPQTWQELALDLTSGPGLIAEDAVERIVIQFTDPIDLLVRDVRFVGESTPDASVVLDSSRLFESREQASDWQWYTQNQYRAMFRCDPLPPGVAKPIAWAAIDFESYLANGDLLWPGVNTASVRVVEYDPVTRQAVSQVGADGTSSLLVPCKTEVYPRLPMPYRASEIRRPRQVSWLRRDDGPERPVYAVYFDVMGQGETEVLASPVAIGTGDTLAFGEPVGPTPARGTPMPMDFNNDGLLDLLTIQNTVPDRGASIQINHGSAEREQLAPPVYVGNVSIKGTPQVADIDGDGKLDVGHQGGFYSDVIGQGFTKHVRIQNPPEFDIFRTMPESRGENWRFVDWDGDGVRDVLVGGNYWWEYGWATAYNAHGVWTRGPVRGWFYYFRNRGTDENFILEFPQRLTTTDGQVAEMYGYASPVVFDIDRDGDLDLISGDFLDQLLVFENVGSRTEPRLAPGKPVQTTKGNFRADRQVVTPVVVDWDQDGDDDLLLRTEGSWITLLENTSNGNEGMPVFLPERYLDSDYDRLNVGELPVVEMHDWDGDGDLDLIYGNSSGELGWFANNGSGDQLGFSQAKPFVSDGHPIRVEAGPNGSLQGPAEARWGYTVPDAEDWDGDGLSDLMLNDIWGLIKWYRNTGAPDHSSLAAAEPVMVEWEGQTPKPAWRWWDPEPGQWSTQWRCTVRMIDWTGDGLLDAVCLDSEGYLVLHERYRDEGQLKLGPPKRIFMGENGQPFQANPVRPGNTGRIKFDFIDWDGDGDRDYIQVVPASWHRGNACWYENIGSDESPILAKRTDLGDVVLTGHTASPWWGDLDHNGSLDVLIAAEAGHFYFFSREYIDHKEELRALPISVSK